MKKEQIEFWLNRRIRDLEVNDPNHEQMVTTGVPYEHRIRAIAQQIHKQERNKNELEAFETALKIVRSMSREEISNLVNE
jgi:HEPN domain-containing protein